MRRRMDLIRILLEYVEQKETESFQAPPIFEGFTCQEVYYHVTLCGEAGYLTTRKISSLGEACERSSIGRLTWEGHEALERLRQ